MVSIISERIRVANIINQFLSNKISIDEAILEMPDLEKTRDPSIDSVDHLLHHIKLEKKSKSSYVKKLKIDLDIIKNYLFKGKEIPEKFLYKPFY